MIFVTSMLRGTPWVVFVLFTYLLWIGLQRLKPGIRRVWRIWIIPVIFISWGIVGLFTRTGSFSEIALYWLAGAVSGGMLGGIPKMSLHADRERHLVQQSGSVLPLVRNMTIFGAHYCLNVAAAVNPMMRTDLIVWDVYVSGASAGYFVGWAIRFIQSYRHAPQINEGK
jgi:hypothetical protein